jgi:15-cis-phytoene synthase
MLAIAYAPARARAALTVLFQLDERFRGIVATTTEPMIGLMRLAWWREALERLDAATIAAEPLLRAVAATLLPLGVSGRDLAEIEDGWAALLDDNPDMVRRHATRGEWLFRAGATVLGAGAPLAEAGRLWAMADLVRHAGDPALAARAAAEARGVVLPHGRWPSAARPFAMLAVLAARDLRAPARRQGHPLRLLRMLALHVSGR